MTIELKEKELLSPRVARLKESLLETVPRLSLERVPILLESYRETEGQPPAIRRARVFEKLLNEMTIFIDENPIVGTQTQYRCGMQPYPENSCEWMLKEIETRTSLGAYVLTSEDREWIKKAVDYWHDKCRVYRAEQLWKTKHEGEPAISELEIPLLINTVMGNRARVNIDYAKVLNKGLNGIIGEARARLQALPIDSLEALGQRDFLEGVVIALGAVISFANRYAALAESMAAQEADPARRSELERIARTCRWVPANPARDFFEAVQSFWFAHVASEIEEPGDGRSPGRLGQYLNPFYQRDIERGAITREEAIDLLELLFIKFTEMTAYRRQISFAGGMGNMYQNIALGGVTVDGDDATAELDYLLIEAQSRVQLIQPTLSILYHDRIPEELLLRGAELVRTGIGMPAFFNNDEIIQGLVAHGVSLEDARNCCIVGCVERSASHTMCSFRIAGGLSMPKLLELAFNNGRDPLTGKQLGPQTGDLAGLDSYDALESAVRRQFEHFMRLKMEWETCGAAVGAAPMPQPFTSALVDDCIQKGTDEMSGGARYEMDGATPVGIVDLADSLAAVKKLVFEEKKVSMRTLAEALRADFEGYDELHHALLSAPKYGNDDDYVDLIAKRWFDIFEREHQKYLNYSGKKMRPFTASVTFHTFLGKSCGALPSGRKARIAFADASVSAYPGMDKSGPTALVRSGTKVLDTIKYASGMMNMKFHPSVLRTRDGLKKLLALVKTYIDLGGHHIQFNVVSAGTLRDAQLHPEKYRSLIVRVAGFSAYFIHLDRDVQDEIIRRTELSL